MSVAYVGDQGLPQCCLVLAVLKLDPSQGALLSPSL